MYEQFQNQLKNRIDENNEDDSQEDIIQLVTFDIGSEKFGIDILQVQEIIRMVDITRVPNSESYVKGVINLRGKIIPIIELRARFGIDMVEYNNETRIIVLEDEEITVGFVVDKVNQVTNISKDTVENAPPMIEGIDSDYIAGVSQQKEHLIIILETAKILEIQEEEV
jgi:purine-binding chemotaxis protein CheW